MARRRALAAIAVAAATALAIGIAPGAARAGGATATGARAAEAAAPPPAFKFNPPLALLDGNGANTGAAEPSIDVDTPGNVYVTGPRGVPTGGCPFWTIHPGTFDSNGLPYEYRGAFDTYHGSVGGGDCDITHGARSPLPFGDTADDVAVSSLSLANLTTNMTQDAGATFRTPANTVGGGQMFGVDRQWQAADRDLGTYYLIVHDANVQNIQSAISYDGGYQYVSNTPAIDANTLPAAQQDNHFSTIAVDTRTHKLYVAFVAPANAQENAKDAQNGYMVLNEHVVYVAVGDPCATTPCVKGQPLGPISWTDYKAYAAPSGQDLAHIFPSITIDRGDRTGAHKNLYIGWIGATARKSTNRFNMIHASVDDPTHWSAPITIDDGKNHSNMFPWLVAGRSGVVDAAWYGGKLVGSGSTCPAGTEGATDDSEGVNNNCFNQWRVTFAQITNATSSTPTVTRSFASGINHRGSICDQGLNCDLEGGDRSLLDFFDVALDPAGGANLAFVVDESQIVYTRQCTGLSATTGLAISRPCGPLAPTPPPPAPVCGTRSSHAATVVHDATGDSQNPTGAPTNGSVDALAVSVADAGANVDVTLKVADLQDPGVPQPGTADLYYYVTWVGPDGTQYGVEHDEPVPANAKTFVVGQYDPTTNQLTTSQSITGSYNAG